MSTDQVWDDAGTANTFDGVLSRLCLLLAIYERDIGHMDIDEVVLASLVLKLGQSLNERHAFDITNSATLRKLTSVY